jgi:hypothetical protein
MQASKEKESVEGKPVNTRQQSHALAAAAAAKRSKNENKKTDRITDQRRDKLLELQRKVKKKKESSNQKKKKKGPCATTFKHGSSILTSSSNQCTQCDTKRAQESNNIKKITNRTYLCRRSWKSNVAFPSRNNDTRLGQKKT